MTASTSAQPLVIYVCGADRSWEGLVAQGFRRRHSCLVRELVRHPDVQRVVVFMEVMRSTYLEMTRRPRSEREFENGKVVDVYVAAMLPERWWLPGTRLLNRLLMRLQVKRQIQLHHRPAVWCYWPKGFRLAKKLGLPGDWVFDADYNMLNDVVNFSARDHAGMERFMEECARRVQLVVTGSRGLIQWLERRHFRHTAYLRNGVDASRFEDPKAPPDEVERIPRPRIGYVGTLLNWVDYELLAELAQRRPDWNFIIVGPAHGMPGVIGFEDLRNVSFLGQRTAREIPAILQSFDVGLGLYRWMPATPVDGDSMKLFEYLAAKVPVVSTLFHPHLREDFDGLVTLAEGPEQFERAIASILAQPRKWDDEREARRRSFLAANGWNSRAREAVRLMQALNAPLAAKAGPGKTENAPAVASS